VNILVCLKQTFDTEEKIVLENGRIREEGVNFIINPYDEYAVEEAIRIKEARGGEVTVVTVGPGRAESALRTALAMGADRAVHVEDETLSADGHAVAKVLAAVARKGNYDLILAGYMAVDDGAGQVGPRLAEELGMPHVSAVTKLTVEDGRIIAEKDAEGDTMVVECPLPALVTAQQGLNEPRYPSLPGIMKAKNKPLERYTAQDLGISPEDAAGLTEVTEQFLPAPKKPGRILQGSLEEQAAQLVAILRNEEKIV